MIFERIKEISSGLSVSFSADIEVDYHDGYPITVNNKEQIVKVIIAASNVVGDGVQPAYLTMGAEDMSYYLQKVPGCFFFIGSAPVGETVPHHCSHFDINEDALLVVSSILVEMCEWLLKR